MAGFRVIAILLLFLVTCGETLGLSAKLCPHLHIVFLSCTTFRTNFQQIGHYFCISNVNTTQKVRPTNSPRKNSSPTHTSGAVEKLLRVSKGGLYIESPTTYVSMRTLDATSFCNSTKWPPWHAR